MSAKKRTKRGRRTLFRRVFLHGLLMILAVVVSVGLLFHGYGYSKEPHRAVERLGEELAKSIDPDDPSQEKLNQKLQAISFVSEKGMAVYTDKGDELARAGRTPPSPLPSKKASRLRRHPEFFRVDRNSVAAMRLPPVGEGRPSYLLVAWNERTGHGGFFVALAVVVLVIGLLSLPLARSITKPLEKLTGAVKRVGAGDLSARSGVSRRDEVGQLAETFDAMTENLASRISREKELLADISHEIRTPLARIKVALELADEIEGTPEQLKDHLRGILGDADELDDLVENVLMISRLDLAPDDPGSALRVNLEPVSVEDIVNRAAGRFASTYPGRTLETELPETAPELRADLKLINRLVDNLISNAVKYSPDETSIGIKAVLEEETIAFEVWDEGIGVEAEDLPKLFDPFFRTDRSRSRDIGGTGLGLTLCKRIAEAHGGTIEARQQDPAGVVIRFTLPKEK